ncbi:TonB-dependent receptor plug domain-containing protein [Aliikangiella coralliicola]|nr:TonB-dependent receptor [Aliikangiella coralliicola]
MLRTLILLVALSPLIASPESPYELFDLSLEELLFVRVKTASGIEESVKNAPAAMIIVTQNEIAERGYNDLAEVLADLPGFDVRFVNGSLYTIVQARGHTSLPSTLFMVDGVVENTLWDLSPVFSRQYPLSNIKQIEIMYGPGSAVHGPNALAAVVNVITNDGKSLDIGDHKVSVHGYSGEYSTKSIELSAMGREEELYYSISARSFESDEPDFSSRWGFLSNELYSDRRVWGPLLDVRQDGLSLGHYADPTEDWGVIAKLGYGNTRLSVHSWQTKEGYGPTYAADRIQNNVYWRNNSNQIFLENETLVNDELSLTSLLLYRKSRIWGNWAEALPDFVTPDETQSLISYTRWNTYSHSTLLKEDFEYQLSTDITINGGIKFERKELTKAYDIPGYYGAFSSTVPNTELGPLGLGAAIFHSSNLTYSLVPFPDKEMPSDNLQTTDDYGVYFQSIINTDNFRYHLGGRFDKNSIYGSSFNPRLSLIYNLSEKSRVKLSYQEAFLEPSALILFGGFSDRNADPERRPEETKNLELIWQFEHKNWQHDASLYQARYDNSVRQGQVVEHETIGLEYRGRYQWQPGLSFLEKLSGYLYYTYTDSTVALNVLSSLGIDEFRTVDVGGSAPHKIRLGSTFVLNDNWSVNVRASYDAKQKFLFGHSFRLRGDKAPSVFDLSTAVQFKHSNWRAGLKIKNLLDKDNFQAHLVENHAGDDFSSRSQGFANPLIPQPKRAWYFFLSYQMK